MKGLSVVWLGLFLGMSCVAEPVYFGSKRVELPEPVGFVKATDEMSGVLLVVDQLKDQENELIAYYFPEEGKTMALEGEIPSLEKTFMVKIHNGLLKYSVTAYEFETFRAQVVAQAEAGAAALQEQVYEAYNQMGEAIKDIHDLDVAFSVSNMITLPVHYQDETSVSYSMLMEMGTEVDGEFVSNKKACTLTFVNASGKILSLGAYAHAEELEWTREQSKQWAAAIAEANQL